MADPTVVGAVIAARLSDLRATLDRQAAFVRSPAGEAATPGAPERETPADAVETDAAELVLRAMRTLGDRSNYQLLTRLTEADATLDELALAVELPPITVWERVNDLVQCGLVGRSLEHDAIGLSAAGQELVAFVQAAAACAAERAERDEAL